MNMNMLKRWYSGNDWAVTGKAEVADFIVMATCGFSQSEEDNEIQAIERLQNIKKDSCEIIITGCLPQINKDRINKVFDGRCVKIVDMKDFNGIMNFDKKIEQFENNYVSQDEYDTNPEIAKYFKMRKKFEQLSFLPLVKVPNILLTVPSEEWFLIRCAMGCTGKCSYCGIKNVHGAIKSEPIEEILRQTRSGINKGFKEISLTGEDLGGYGVDLRLRLTDLLDELLRLPGDFKINLRYIDPYWLIKLADKLIPIFQTGRITAFCSPVQSGSDRILKLMNRKYTFDDISKVVREVVKHTKVGMISTNIIVGFPTETDDDFEQSLRLVKEVPFGMYMAFPYEERPGTKAATFDGKIADHLKTKRHRQLMRAINWKHFRYCSLGA